MSAPLRVGLAALLALLAGAAAADAGAAATGAGVAAADDDTDWMVEEQVEYDRWFVGAGASLVLPQGGQALRRLGGGALRGGYYFTEMLAVEAEAAWLEDRAGLAVQGLWHWWGYERFDPFFTFGVRGWLPDGQVGPCGGAGAFWHLDEHWSLRFDAGATLGLERDVGMVYALGLGVQRSF